MSALAIAMALPWSPARAEPGPGGWSIAGRITDMAGRVIPRSYASDGWAVSYADSSGAYRLNVDAQQLFDYVAAGGGGTEYQTGREVSRIDNTEHVDFQLKFQLAAEVAPFLLADSPTSVNVAAYSRQPATDCVVVIDPATQARTPLSLEATGNYNTWRGDLPVDPATATGLHSIDVVGVTCDTGVELTSRYAAQYLVDRAAPTVEITSPRSGRLVVDNVDLGPSPDGTTSAAGAVRIAMRAADDAVLWSASIELRTLDGDFVDRCYLSSAYLKPTVEGSCRFVERGRFVATATASDFNGHEIRSAPLRITVT